MHTMIKMALATLMGAVMMLTPPASAADTPPSPSTSQSTPSTSPTSQATQSPQPAPGEQQAPPPPSGSDYVKEPQHCRTDGRGLTLCIDAFTRNQDDGTGSVLMKFDASDPRCAVNPHFDQGYARVSIVAGGDPDNGRGTSLHNGMQCFKTFYMPGRGLRGPDAGPMAVHIHLKGHPGGHNYDFRFDTCQGDANGDSVC